MVWLSASGEFASERGGRFTKAEMWSESCFYRILFDDEAGDIQIAVKKRTKRS